MRYRHVELWLGVEIYRLGAHQLLAYLAYTFAPVARHMELGKSIFILRCSQTPLCFKPFSLVLRQDHPLGTDGVVSRGSARPSISKMRYLSLVIHNTTNEPSARKGQFPASAWVSTLSKHYCVLEGLGLCYIEYPAFLLWLSSRGCLSFIPPIPLLCL